MTMFVIDDKDELYRAMRDEIQYYKDLLKVQAFGLTHGETLKKIIECVNAAEDDENEENEDYDWSIAYSDIKWFLRTAELLKGDE